MMEMWCGVVWCGLTIQVKKGVATYVYVYVYAYDSVKDYCRVGILQVVV